MINTTRWLNNLRPVHNYAVISVRVLNAILVSVALVLSACSSAPVATFRCNAIEPWIQAAQALAGNTDLNKMSLQKMPQLIYPVFSDDVFKATFHTSYFELTETQRVGIYQSFNQCKIPAWVRYGLATPFVPKNRRNLNVNYSSWEPYLVQARKTTYVDALAEKTLIAEKRKKEQQLYIEKLRLARLRKKQQNKSPHENFEKDMNAVLDAASAAIIAGTILKKTSTKYQEYGDCAPKLRDRLARCYVTLKHCESSRCYYEATCDNKKPLSNKCGGSFDQYDKFESHYYCDNETGKINVDKKTVINSICAKQAQ